MSASKLAAESQRRLGQAREQHRAGAGSVLDALLRQPGASLDEVTMLCARWGGVPVLVLATQARVDFSQLERSLAQQWRCVLVRPEGQAPEVRWLAMADPWDEARVQQVARHIGVQPIPAAVSDAALAQWLGDALPGAVAVDPAPQADGPIVGFVDAALAGAFEGQASDIHFECDRGGVSVKFRLDGVMSGFARMEGAQQAQEVISRIKVLAQLDITERRLPQDGRFRWQFGGCELDLRVSIMPSIFGEDAVLRLLDRAQLRARESAVSLGTLGFDEVRADLIRALAQEPSGMLLVTGPTGSGKTTTVYAALSEINTGLEKLITIEDPVEYELPGVLQIPVNERKGLTFARGLRSILRHDPDRILVGEIRDAETAEIAVQSALTGHLVFTTVHANSVSDVVGRFRHFGLDMFGFMSSLNGVVVQRLIRRLCPACAIHRIPHERERDWLSRHGQRTVDHIRAPAGCPACRLSGYQGRFVIAEVHLVDDELRDAVTQGAPLTELREHARRRQVATLAEQAAQQVASGVTSTEEIKRVVGWL